MYQRRVKYDSGERAFYLVTNRVAGGSFVFGDTEKEHLRKLMFDGQDRYGCVIWDYCLMDNHYHVLIEVRDASEMSRDELLGRWYRHQRSISPGDPGDVVLEAFRKKIHDISAIVSNFQQRLTQWYNNRNNRWGRLFGGRFNCVILDRDASLALSMAYITLNPVRAGIVVEPAEYRWCGYAERMEKAVLQKNDIELVRLLQRELGLPNNAYDGPDETVLGRVWDRFREFLLGQVVERQGIDRKTVADKLNSSDKPLKLLWCQRLMLKASFTTKGVAVGSRGFVEDILAKSHKTLDYRKPHQPERSRAWDQIYCLKRHRTWVQ